MSARKRVAPDFAKLLGGSEVKMDVDAVAGSQPAGPDEPAVDEPRDVTASGAGEDSEESPAPAPVETVATPPNPTRGKSKPPEPEPVTRPAPQRKKPAPVYEYERIDNFSNIEETWIQTNVKMHPGVRTSYSTAVKILKNNGSSITGRRFVHEAMIAKFLTMPPFGEYTQRLHDEAETEHARKLEDRPGESAEQWRPPRKA